MVGVTDANPVIGEEHVLARVDARHVALDAIPARPDGAGDGGGPGAVARARECGSAAGVAGQAGRVIGGAVGGRPWWPEPKA